MVKTTLAQKLKLSWHRAKDRFHELRFDAAVMLISAALLTWLGIGLINVRELLFKFLLLTFAVTYAHLTRRTLWRYVNLSDCIFGVGLFQDVSANVRAAVVLGLYLFYAAVILAVLTW